MKNIKSFKEFLNERYEHDEELKSIDNPELVKYAEDDNLSKIKELLSNGVNPDSKDKYGNTALMLAPSYGYLDIVKELLKHNADVNNKNIYGITALIEASCNDYLNVVKELLKHGADTSITNKYNKTAFDYAKGKVKDYFISQGITK